LKKISEYGAFPSGFGTFTRPDSSGIRGGFDGNIRRPWSRLGGKGSEDHPEEQFPYDIDTSYGEPAAYDRGSKTGTSHNPIVPRDTSHSAWDDLGEAMGTPMNFQQAYLGDHGGSGEGWATMPIRPWDEDDVEEQSMFNINTGEPSVPPPEEVPGPPLPDDEPPLSWNDQLLPSRTIFVVGTPAKFGQGIGLSARPSRGRYGLIPKESVSIWNTLQKFIER
jgi:hypothetical protein